jgi:hypothetical protein
LIWYDKGENMSNKITEKYFKQTDFSTQAAAVLTQVSEETGFVAEKEIWRGVIYDKNKVGSLIYRGVWQNKPAVLKLQGLKPEIDEQEMVEKFNAQNKSRRARLPEIYLSEPWNEKRGYGYLICEYLDAPLIFKMPFASSDEMRDFVNFYQEYRELSLTKPWLPADQLNSLDFTRQRVEHWQKISEAKGRLKASDYIPYLNRYYSLIDKNSASVPMVFCHGHLTANDIFKLPNGSYVLLSNLFWSYRPQWYDLAFNLWACFLNIRDVNFSFNDLIKYLESWLEVYREIPVVKADADFSRKIYLSLLERTIGAILVDLGASETFERPENRKFFKHLLRLHQSLFYHLCEKI